MMRNWMLVPAVALLLAACGGGGDGAASAEAAPLQSLGGLGKPPLVIAHRGASGERPEHTLAAYQRAIDQGADFIEPDLVLTKDGVLIARHEPMLDHTTDVASQFSPDRRSTRNLDGVPTTAYFASDFTLAELRTLRAVQPNAARPQQFNGEFGIPTLDEIIAVAKAAPRQVGIYPEIKHATFHAVELGFGRHTFEDKLLAQLHAAWGNGRGAPVFIQSFEVAPLQYLRTKTKLRLVQLVDAFDVNADGSLQLQPPFDRPFDFAVANDPRTFADLLTPAGLDFVRSYADAIGPWKPYLVRTVDDGIDRTGDGVLTIHDRRVDGSTGVTELAHARGLGVHTWTFRNDASGYGFADPLAEMAYYLRLGIDGVFTDFPATGVAARDTLRGVRPAQP